MNVPPGLSLGYVLGRVMGEPVLKIVRRKKNAEKYVDKSYDLVNTYGSYALCISYFFPIVRHIVPYLVGINNMSFRRYALYSYTTGFLWTLIFFLLGSFFGKNITQIGEAVYNYGLYFLLIILFVAACVWTINRFMRKAKREK